MIKKIKARFNRLKYGLLKDNRVGIIKIEGIILDTGPIPVAGKIVESIKTAEKLGIKNIVVRINSPGGTVGASQEIYRELKKAQEEGTKIITSLGDVAASGGLYIAVAGDKIVANPGTVTGSIGVIIKTNVLKTLYRKIGIDSQVVKSGEYKDILSSTKYLSKEEKEILQSLIDSTYEQFIEEIAVNRKIDREEVRKFADGRIFSGTQAKELGLVDEIGSLSDAVDLIAKMAEIKEKPVTIDLSPKKSFMQKLTGASMLEVLENAGLNGFYNRIPLWLMSDF